MANDNNNDVVILHLDRPREVRFGHKALKTLIAITGKSLESLDESEISLEDIEKFMYCGLLYDARKNGETLTLEQMEDLLDMAPKYTDIVEAMSKAFEISNGGKTEGNAKVPQTAVAAKAQKK